MSGNVAFKNKLKKETFLAFLCDMENTQQATFVNDLRLCGSLSQNGLQRHWHK